jgi:uncharacterized repeat protein (TIGR03803 family)
MHKRRLLQLGLSFAAAVLPLDYAFAAHVTVLHTLTGPDGRDPEAAMTIDATGTLTGTTMLGGKHGHGTIFTVAPDGSYRVLYDFTGHKGDQTPIAKPLRDASGNLFGTTYGGSENGAVYRLSASGEETVLHRFSSNDAAGYSPAAPLIADKHGNLYGTTTLGGANGGGTAFRLSPRGHVTVLHAFGMGGDGAGQIGGLTADKDGNLYGTSALGGAHNGGVVFKIAADGTETVLHSFAIGPEGFEPWGGVIRDKAGNLYGTTFYGPNGPQSGTVYKLAPDGTFTTLYAFHGLSDGSAPIGDLVTDRRGDLFGTTSTGANPENGGTVFRLSADGALKTLYTFDTAPRQFHNGIQPHGGLAIDAAGNLFGTTSFGGDRMKRAGEGTIFAIDAH